MLFMSIIKLIQNAFKSKEVTKKQMANRNFIEQVLQGYTDVLKIWVSDRDMVLPTKEAIENALNKVKPFNHVFNNDNFFCKQFMVTLWSDLIKLPETLDWAMGYIVYPVDGDSHITVCIMDNELNLHSIGGQYKTHKIIEKGTPVYYIFL